ncbi:MAG: hypothetical protein HW400_277 [Candidatus Levybacteria bacterium]|nr:hypothetical protein [Candidatus Levybacteria bacterium]
MNQKVNADIKALKIIYDKNKLLIIPIVVILVSLVLFFQFVIPQFNALITLNKQAKESELKLQVLKKNLDMLSNINESTLDSQLSVLTQALPFNKDFIGILNSVYSTAQMTGVGLGGFSFAVGDLSKPESSNNSPVVTLSLPINSSVMVVNSFVETISKTVPLAEVSLIKVGASSSVVNLSFYYKPKPSVNSQDVLIRPISQKGLTLINQLKEFKNVSSVSQ